MTMQNSVVDALCRSTLFEALAIGFATPGLETAATLTGAAAERFVLAAEVLDGARGAATPSGTEPGLVPAARALAATRITPAEVEASHRHLFGHTAQGLVPAYEGEYGPSELLQKPQAIADVAGFYAAFGLELAIGGRGRADHVACECEFMMFLARKEAWAMENGDGAMLEETALAGRAFLRDHLAPFLPGLASRLRGADGDGFYGRLADLALAVAGYDCARLDVPLGPLALPIRPALDDGVPMACGRCPLGDGTEDGEEEEADACV